MESQEESILEKIGNGQKLDFEAIEFLARATSHKAGALVLEKKLQSCLEATREQTPVCSNRHQPRKMLSQGYREKTIVTLLGPIRLKRRYYRCPVCGATAYPQDEALSVSGTKFSPASRKLMAWSGSDASFAKAAENLELLAGLQTTAKAVERVSETTGREVGKWMERQGGAAVLGVCEEATDALLYVSFDGTGTPMRKEELQQSKGKNGASRTREVKLGCVFTQTGLDNEGRPVREENSTTYCGAIEPSIDFGHRIAQEALRRGMSSAARTVVITDGATYNKSIIAEHFPHATAILDLYHAREHLGKYFRDVLNQEPKGPLYEALKKLLDNGQIEKLLARLRHHLPRNGPRRKKGLGEIAYFKSNKEAMRYDTFRKQNLFVGSGVIEAGCKTIIARRMKNSGMFWSLQGANAIIALRCCKLSNRLEDFWEQKVA